MAKTKRAKSRINAGEIVLSTLKKLMRNTGWTTRTIVKFIKTEYSISDRNIGRKVSRALKNYNRMGLVQNEKGRYRLRHARMARCRSSSELRRSKPCHMRRCRRSRVAKRRGRSCHRPLRIRSRSPSPNRRGR